MPILDKNFIRWFSTGGLVELLVVLFQATTPTGLFVPLGRVQDIVAAVHVILVGHNACNVIGLVLFRQLAYLHG
jgi:hypothetical protein